MSNRFDYNEFLQFREQTGAEAVVIANFRDGLLRKKPLKEAAAHAAALAAYRNAPVAAKLPDTMSCWAALRAENGRTKPYRVRYLQIGNKTWASLNEARKLAPQGLGLYYVDCRKAYINPTKAVDPEIDIIVDGHDSSLRGAVPLALDQLAGQIDYLTTHLYRPRAMTEVSRAGRNVGITELSAEDIGYAWTAITRFDEHGRSVYKSSGLKAARRAGYRVAITEWNWSGWRRNTASTLPVNSRWVKGVGAAGFIHTMMRSGDVTDMACQSTLMGMAWGISAMHTDPTAIKDPVYLPTGQLTAFYSKHHGNRLMKVGAVGAPTHEQPYRMGGIRASKKVALIDAAATADQTAVSVHAINRRFDKPREVTINPLGFEADDRVVHRSVRGRLNDAPPDDQPDQIGREITRTIEGAPRPLTVTLPNRSVSCLEISLPRQT